MPAAKSTSGDADRQETPDRSMQVHLKRSGRQATGNRETVQQQGVSTLDVSGYLGEAAPVDPAPSYRRVKYIQTRAALDSIIPSLAAARVIGVDAEFAQPRLKHPDEPPLRLSVVQLASDVDPRHVYVV